MVTQVSKEPDSPQLTSPLESQPRLSPAKPATGPLLRLPNRPLVFFLAIGGLTLGISVASILLVDPAFVHRSLFDLPNFTGPTTRTLLNGGGLSFCWDGTGFGGNPICFHAARMPIGPFTVAAGALLFGDSFLRVSLFKIVLFLLPLEFAVFLVCTRLPASRLRRTACAFLLLVPFGMTIFMANVVNMQVEENFAYSLIACALAIVLFGPLGFPRPGRSGRWSSAAEARLGPVYLVLFVLVVDGLYLSKSSMSLAAAVLAAAFFFQQRGRLSRAAVLVLVLAAPIGWAIRVHHASGRYSLGTSLDGLNLHKGNGPIFIEHYPPLPLTSLDDYDDELNARRIFTNEWTMNDYHMRAGIEYIRTHPRQTLIGEWRKFKLLYLSITKYGASDSHGLKLLVEKEGLILFRLIFWTTIAVSLFALFLPRLRGLRPPAAAYLALVAACALPYLIGFGYTRHASILIYPACLMGCRFLCAEECSDPTPK